MNRTMFARGLVVDVTKRRIMLNGFSKTLLDIGRDECNDSGNKEQAMLALVNLLQFHFLMGRQAREENF